MEFSRRSISSQIGLISILLVVVVGVLGWFLVWPGYTQFREAQDRGTQLAQALETKNKTYSEIDGLVNKYNSNKNKLESLSRAVPSAPQVPQILAMVESLAKQSGMTRVMTLTVTEESAGGGAPAVDRKPAAPADSVGAMTKPALVTLKVTLTVAGNYGNLPLLFDLLEKNLRLFEIQTITAQATGKGEAQTFNLTFNTFYQN
jgi:hypothetical protein